MQNGRLMVRVELLERMATAGMLGGTSKIGRPSGSLLNDFALPILTGGTMTLSQWRGRRVVLIYLSRTCIHCEEMLSQLASAVSQTTGAGPAVLIVSSGSVQENRKFFGKHVPACPVVLQEESEVSALHHASVTPMAYVVDEQGVTYGDALVGTAAILNALRAGSGAGVSDEARADVTGGVPQLVPVGGPAAEASSNYSAVNSSVMGSRINRNGLKAGTAAPDFTLPSLEGSELSLNSFRGKPVLLVFSDPNCGPCDELMPKLEQIHRTSEDLQVLVISRGDPAENRNKVRKLGLTFPMVLQKQWEISRAYGMFATPIGYLVGEDGVLVQDVAVGGTAILALMKQRPNVKVQVAG
jgi:peroxiredoxin